MRVARTLALALAVAVPATSADALTSSGLVHVASGSTETAAPGTALVLRGTDLSVLNAPSNPDGYTYVLSNGTDTYNSGQVTRGSVGAIAVPAAAPAGTYTFSRVGSGVVLARVDVR